MQQLSNNDALYATYTNHNREKPMKGKILEQSVARQLVVDILVAYGASKDNSDLVADHLVDADLAGVRSHGLIRVPQYVDEILSGEINPDTVPSVSLKDTDRVDIEGNRCFGQVACTIALEQGALVALKRGISLVTVRNTGHVGRIGAYAEALGRKGFLSVLFCSGPKSGHRVAPFNGREGRLSTNPIAFSIPTKSDPIIGDFSTASAPEGRIRYLRDLGLPAPPETLLDASGRPTTDPNALYGDKPGTIMPLGGYHLGHRGFALGLLVEAIATLLPGDESTDESRIGNNVAIVIISVDSTFATRAEHMADYILTSSQRDDAPVVLPGSLEQERRKRSHVIEIDKTTWEAITERAKRCQLSLDRY